MRGDNLMKHMKKHELGNDDNVVTKGFHDGKTEENDIITNGQQISCTNEKFIVLEKKVIGLNKEFDKIIEHGRNLILFFYKHGFN